MFMDTSLELCKGMALSAASNDSTNTIDFDQDQLLSVPLALVVLIAGSGTTAKETTFTVKGSDNNTTFTDLLSFKVPEAEMVDGKHINYLMPLSLPRYVKLTVAPTAADSGVKVSAFFTVSPDTPREKADFPFASTIA